MTPFADLTDVTLADEDTNSILADNANRAIQGNVAIQVVPLGGQIWNQCKLHHPLKQTMSLDHELQCGNESGAIWLPKLQPILLAIWPTVGQIYDQCK